MKIVWIGTFSYAQVLEVVNFLEEQNTSDRVNESTTILYDDESGTYEFKVVCNKNKDIEKIIIRLVKKEGK